jgi:toxin YoeB
VRHEAQLVTWKLVFTRQGQKDEKKLAAALKKSKAEVLLKILTENPVPNSSAV